MVILQHKVQDFETLVELRAMATQPSDTDKFFCEETNIMYDYDPSLTVADDGKNYIALDNFPGRFQIIEKEVSDISVPYNGHSFVGKKMGTNILGWDYHTFVFDITSETVTVIFSDNGYSSSNSFGAGDLDGLGSKIINDFYYTNFVPNSGNTTQLSYTVSGTFMYFTVIGAVHNNLQITIRNDNTGVWGDGNIDPDADGLNGIAPYTFSTPTVGVVEYETIELGSSQFDCATDKVLFIREGAGQVVNGDVLGWSQPEGTQWSNIPLWDNRSWTVFFNSLETDGLGNTSTTPVTQAFASFELLIAELNNQLATYGSSFRLLGATNNRIFVTQLDGTIIVSDTDPYLGAHSYGNMGLVIEDSVTNSDWLVKGRNPKPFTVSNISAGVSGGMFKGKIPCPSGITVPTPQISILSGHGSTGVNTISLVAKYSESDRWILDYEPEIYLYFKKKKRGSNAIGKHNIRYRHKLAHCPKSDGSFSTQSLKKDVNPRLNAVPEKRVVDTEWLVDGTQTEMTTQFTIKPFQFLGSIPYGDAGTGTFPMAKSDWNKNGTGTCFPSTLTTKNLSSQTSGKGRPVTHMTAYFKTVIRNPNGGHPIESEESYPIIIYPDVHVNLTGDPSQYASWGVNINYNTR